MSGVEGIEAGVAGDAAGAADSGDDGHLVQIGLGIEQRAREAVDGGADAASGAPDVRHAVHAQERLDRIDGVRRNLVGNFERQVFGHRTASVIALRMASGLCTLPPAWVTGMTLALPSTARATSWTIWPRLSSGTTKALTRPASSRMRCSGNGQAEMMRNLPARMPCRAGQLDGPLRDARRDAIGDDHDFGIFQILGLAEGAAVGERLELVLDAADRRGPESRRSCWDSRARRASGR